MTAKRRENGPLVPLDPERLEIARKTVGLTVNALAKKARVVQQTLDAMRRGSGRRRCHRSIRDRLAKALDLPTFESNGSRWLGGEVDLLYRSVTLFDEGGAKYDYQRIPAAVDLARLRLIERCRLAWTREKAEPQDTTVPPRPARIPESAKFHLLQIALEQLTSCIWWRSIALQTNAFPQTRAEYEAELQALPEGERRAIMEEQERAPGRLLLWDEMSQNERKDWLEWGPEPMPPALSDDLANRIERAFIEAFEALLEPWFNGDGQLRYARLMAPRGGSSSGLGRAAATTSGSAWYAPAARDQWIATFSPAVSGTLSPAGNRYWRISRADTRSASFLLLEASPRCRGAY